MERDFNLFARDRNISSLALYDYNKYMEGYIEPTIVEERSLHATQLTVFSRLFMDRILFLGTPIDSMVANIINSQLLFLDMEKPETPIKIYINSPGGSVYDGLSIYDCFNHISCPVHTTCVGLAASMGAVLLTAGEKGNRSALPHSRIMIHQPSAGIGHSQASDIEILNNEVQKLKTELYRIISDTTGKDEKTVLNACDRDNWFTAKEAVDFGLIDKVLEKK